MPIDEPFQSQARICPICHDDHEGPCAVPRCDVCCCELSECGPMIADGPTLDCLVCQLRAEIKQLQADNDAMRNGIALTAAERDSFRDAHSKQVKDIERLERLLVDALDNTPKSYNEPIYAILKRKAAEAAGGDDEG